jgi:FKBP-type peptidyl-prolyl cis-trans isomerase 2
VAGLNDDAQWIILMGFLVSFSFFFLAMVINQSTVVGQTTAESVIEFPKNDIRDIRDVIVTNTTVSNSTEINRDITVISLSRKNAVIDYNWNTGLMIHYNNGVTEYNENWTSL